MADHTDVVIVGGGPAGSAAAIWCAQSGLDVLLLEAQPFPRDRPGESLHPGIEPLFDQLGAGEAIRAAGFLRYRGHHVIWGGPPRYEAFGADASGAWLGIHAWRADLDAILLRRAAATGARILQPCRAGAPIIDGTRVVGLESDAGEVRARFVVDASGARHWLHRQAGIGMRRARRSIATYGYATGPASDLDQLGPDPVLSGNRAGWTWVARVRPDLAAWTQLDFTKIQRCPPTAVRALQPTGPVRGADVTWRILETCAGSGFFAVGDAAAVLDPASSHGVLRAIMSGMLAGDLIARVCRGAATESEAAAAVQSWTRGWFARDSRRLGELYAALHDARTSLLR